MATSATDSVSKKEDESARARSKWRWTDGHGRKSARKLEGGTRERGSPLFIGEWRGRNFRAKIIRGERERMGERATWETDSLAASVERRSVAAFLPEIAERDRKGRKEGRRKDLSRKGRRREGGREAQWQMQPKEGREEGKGADIFHRKLSRYRSSWG